MDAAPKIQKRGKPDRVTIGNVTVKIYRRQRPTVSDSTRTIWEVANYVNSQRRLTSFSASARQEAERIAGLLSSGQTIAADLRAFEAAEYGNVHVE